MCQNFYKKKKKENIQILKILVHSVYTTTYPLKKLLKENRIP